MQRVHRSHGSYNDMFLTAIKKPVGKHTIQDMFLTAKQKSANNFQLGKEMIDMTDGMLRHDTHRICQINENWHLHKGRWPEMEQWLGTDTAVMRDEDAEREPMNWNDFVVHHPKLNNVTNYILGGFIAQPLIPVVKDFSTYGRKYREEARLQKAKAYYYENIYAPQEELIRNQYFQDAGITDPMALTPEEQQQVQADLQARMKSQIPRSVLDDMKRIKTPDEKIRQTLLEYDIKAYDIEEKFVLGGEQAIVAYEEYYLLGRKGVKPTLKVLNSKWVRWAGDEACEYSEDGQMAAYDEYQTPHSFIADHGREAIKNKDFMKDIETYFTEVPGYFREGHHGKKHDNTPMFIEAERDFVDMVGENPGLIKNDWRTWAGQQEIAGLYAALSTHHTAGRGIRNVYTVFKWTEEFTYVQREEKGVIQEFMFSADYNKDKSKDKMCIKFPVSRVYHGRKIADRFYIGIEPVPWQFFGGVQDYEPKLTICGRRYAQSNGESDNNTLMGPAIQYQLRYNITASKMEDLEKSDIGKITFWNADMRPEHWSELDYMEMMMKHRNVPYTNTQIAGTKETKPVIVVDAGSTAKMEEYRRSLLMWEDEMYKQMHVNRDALGQANPYQSNAQTQSNIEGSSKQLLPFYNKRRLVKQRVLNYFSNISMLCFLEDPEKQELLLDDFSRMHLQVNADDIKAQNVSIFVVDDFGDQQTTKAIQQQVLTMMQQPGNDMLDVIDIMASKSLPEMRDIAEINQIKTKEAAAEASQQRMAEIQANNEGLLAAEKLKADRKDAIEIRKNQVNLMLGEMESMVMENAADIDENKIADSLQRAEMEIASQEKIAREANETKIQIETIKAKLKAKQRP